MAKRSSQPLANLAQGRAAKAQAFGSPSVTKVQLGRSGVEVPFAVNAGGNGALGLDFSGIDPPVRRYAADLAWLVVDSTFTAKLVFVQEGLAEDELETALIIRLSPAALLTYVEAMEQFTQPSVEQIAELMAIQEQPVEPRNQRPHQTAHAVANFMITTVSGFETCLDVFHAPAPAILRMQHEQKLNMDPVVRVELKTSVYLSLLRKMRESAAAMPAELQNRIKNHG
jgi:hypothetical protein